MFAEERQNQIVSLLNQNGSVRVKELSEQFQVTEDCIRKDLTLLEKRGLLKKSYGGAVKIRINPHDLNVSQRKEKNIEAKQKIASKAMGLIKNGDMVFLDISTANLELAKLLVKSDLNITVVSNMVDILLVFMVPANVKFIFIGGSFSSGHDGFVGAYTNKQIADFRFDLAFLGSVGVDLEENGVFTYLADDGLTKSTVLDYCKRAYLMLETRKFSMDGTYKYASIERFFGAVMEQEAPKEFADKMKEYPIEWI